MRREKEEEERKRLLMGYMEIFLVFGLNACWLEENGEKDNVMGRRDRLEEEKK